MRPHVNVYCAQENGLLTAHKTLRQQVAATSCCNIPGYQAYHAATNTNKWFSYNGARTIQPHAQQQQQRHQPPPNLAKLPMHYQATATNFQLLPHATHLPRMQQQHQLHHHQQQQQIHHLQRLRQYPQSNGINGGFVAAPETHNYAKLPVHAVNQQRINECAGIPLISNASTHLAPTQRQRVVRKTLQSPPHIMQQHAQHTTLMGLRTDPTTTATTAYATWSLPPNAVTCMSQMAVRAQGINLFNNNNNANNNWSNIATSFENNYANAGYNMNAGILKNNCKLEKSRLLRYQNSAPAVLNSQEICAIDTNEEATNNTNESKVMTDTCLPRIIKPRKRRKKERKPTNNHVNSVGGAVGAYIKMDSIVLAGNSKKSNKPMPITADVLLHSKLFKSSEHLFKPCLLNTMAEWKKNENYISSDKQTLLNQTLWSEADDEQLRSIWDYPLRRSFSDTSANGAHEKFHFNWENSSSASSTASSSSSSASSYSLSSCSADSYFSADMHSLQNCTPSRAEIVGVIGSNRTQNTNAELQHINSDVNVNVPRKPLLSACLSDSNDSGYGDILTGINIVNDLFNHKTTSKTPATMVTQNASVHNCTENNTSFLHEADAAATLLLLPETAETLLNESINEISRKLIETCGNELSNEFTDNILGEVPHSACFSTCSEFSNDSGVEINNNTNSITNNFINCDELIFNFDNLHMNETQQQQQQQQQRQQQYHTLSKLASTMENFLMHLNTNNTNTNGQHTTNLCNNNNNTHTLDENNNDCYATLNVSNNNNNNKQKHNQQFVKNCLDLVWPNGNEEVREPPITTMLNSLLEVNTTAFTSLQ